MTRPIEKAELDNLVELFHSKRSAGVTFSEANDAIAKKYELPKKALRRVVSALASDKAGELDTENTAVAAILQQSDGVP